MALSYGIELHVHVDWAFLREDVARLRRLVVEGDVGSERLDVLNLVVRAG